MAERYRTEIRISIGNSEDVEKKHDIFINYGNESEDMCYKVKNHFESIGYQVWTNIGMPKELPIDAIASEWCVLIFILKKHESIAFSKIEHEYASNLEKPYVPLMIEKVYSNGWYENLFLNSYSQTFCFFIFEHM